MITNCIVSPVTAATQEVTYFAPVADIVVSTDTDDFHASRTRVGAFASYINQWRYTGASAQSMHYTQGEFRKDAASVLAFYRDQHRGTLAGIDIEAGIASVSGHLRLIGDSNWRVIPVAGTTIDLSASADLVETSKALDSGIGYTLIAAGLEQQFSERFTATGYVGWQSFSDGNARIHLRSRLIWLALPDQGMTLQLRYRQYASRDADVGGAYFNPDELRQWLGVAAIRKHHAGWVFSAALGAGQEQSTGVSAHPSYLAEVRCEGPLSGNVRLVLHAGYTRSAGFIDSPDYAYRIVGATLILAFP